ncbi:MAG: DNA-processing protein DprA [Clostridia bacterium]|nr:DNA-processing protein DprA [Clostridia bacterium]
MDKRIYEIWLSLACTPDTATFPKLLERFGSAEEIYNATDFDIRYAVDANNSDSARLIDKDLERASEIYNFCITRSVGLVSYFDKEYPELLKKIQTPPVLLYYRGKLPDFSANFHCAIVGTRSLSDYGRVNAFRAGYDLALAGANIVSGMAIGCDGVALAGALAGGAKTIAVLGSGIDVCYPHQHQTLARAIVKEGCVITEYAPGTKPERINFPRRNRIISGLCRLTVFVEGKLESGAMITARHAMKQGRDVFAFPGNVFSPGSEGAHRLIQDGARLCGSAGDIIYAYKNEYGKAILNPFIFPIKRTVNMNAVLSEYKIACVTPTDDIFLNSFGRREKQIEYPEAVALSPINDESVKQSEEILEDSPTEPENIDDRAQVSNNTIIRHNSVTKKASGAPDSNVQTTSPLPEIDRDALKIYKKIPMDTDCEIESLVDESHDLRAVIKTLLKLEMSRFVVMLPGDKVKRNLK